MEVKIKRIYDTYDESDGVRILVDRLWPRGMTKERARLDEWLKDLTPSPELRVWFGHEESKFKDFATSYKAELDNNPRAQEIIQQLIAKNKDGTITLLYAAKDPKVNHALILQEYIQGKAENSS